MHAWYIFQMKDEAQIGWNLFYPFIALQLNWHEWTELKNSISRKLLKRFLNKLCESQWVQKKNLPPTATKNLESNQKWFHSGNNQDQKQSFNFNFLSGQNEKFLEVNSSTC